MLRGFWKLSWVETKVFVREPMGLVGSLAMPVVLFLFVGRMMGADRPQLPNVGATFNVAILGALLIAIGGVQSLVAIIAIYREGGILKRLRATPLSPVTILGAHVAVKLGFTVVSTLLLVAVGKRVFPGVMEVNVPAFGAALLLSTVSILSLGFVVASLVPTARFAQPISTALLYPMLVLSGLFFPLAKVPALVRDFAYLLPTTHAVALLRSVWDGAGWSMAWPHVIALVVLFGVFTTLSTRVFRWE